MKDYTMRPGKEAMIGAKRANMADAQHSQKDAFVKREQNSLASKAGHNPRLEGRYMNMDACMMNNGAHAQKFARELTAGLDKVAYPVNGDVDESQK